MNYINFSQRSFYFSLFSALFAFVSLSSCSTLSPEQCRTADWKEIGRIDGRHGTDSGKVAEHQKACSQVGLEVDRVRYREGWNEGVADYCTPGGGFEAGKSGIPYKGICQVDKEAEFLKQYASGHEVYNLQLQKSATEETLKKRREEIDKDKSVVGDISKAYHLLAGSSPTSTEEDRIDKLSDEIYVRQSDAPVSRYSLQPKWNPESASVSLFGVAVGSTIGFGLGHVIQGHYKQDGWKWTAIDSTLVAAMIAIGNSCPSSGDDQNRAIQSKSNCGSAGFALAAIGLLVSRIWQGVELVTDAVHANSPYSDSIGRAAESPQISLVPQKSGLDLAALWKW